MGLRQIKDADRIIFLKEFTRHMFSGPFEDEKRKETIEIEKLKKRFIEPGDSEDVFKRMIKKQALEPSIYSKIPEEKRKPIFYREKVPISMPVNMTKPTLGYTKSIQKIIPKIKPIQQQPQQFTQFNQPVLMTKINEPLDPMKKIEPLLRDSSILSIECPGPGKNLIVKRFSQINVTQITLSQKDINEIIEYYSKEARIPLVGGLLKAAVGNSIISAVTSEFVGSRFIINKITPYSMIHR